MARPTLTRDRDLRSALLPLATVVGAGLVTWLAVPTVWQTPLNVDEELTLRVAQFSFAHVFDIVSTQRGGGPLHFWLEHFLLGWWPGLPSLRLPSLVFLLLALPAVGLVARRLVGGEGAAAVVLLTAVSPIPVLYSTFGRPHTLLFCWLMWSSVLALRAAATGSRRLWAAAGAALGLAVFVHPTAPLYGLTTFGAALVFAPRHWRQVAREAWPGALALLATFLPYYVKTLHVLGDRYGVGAGLRGRTYSGRPVWEDAIRFVAANGHAVNAFTVLAAVGVVALVVRRAYRVLLFCALTVAAPVVFFTVVPTNGDSALFFDRYMIPVTPAFLALVLAGCLAVAARAGRLRVPVLALLVAGLLVLELQQDLRHLDEVRGIHVDAVVRAVAHGPAAVLFGSSGTTGPDFETFDYGHPPNILDHLVALRVSRVQLVDDDSCERVRPFLAGTAPRLGEWLFYGADPAQAAAGGATLGRVAGVSVGAVSGRYLVVTSRQPLAPRALVALGQRLRLAWKRAVPADARVDELLIADRELLAGTCVPYGELGDPDTSPHWPPVRTTHQ